MKALSLCRGRSVFLSMILITFTAAMVRAEIQSGQVLVLATSGTVTCASSRESSTPLKAGQLLSRGTVVKTGPDSTADLILQYNGTVLRLLPDTTLEFAK